MRPKALAQLSGGKEMAVSTFTWLSVVKWAENVIKPRKILNVLGLIHLVLFF